MGEYVVYNANGCPRRLLGHHFIQGERPSRAAPVGAGSGLSIMPASAGTALWSTVRGQCRPAIWACVLLILWGINGTATPAHGQPIPTPINVRVLLDDPDSNEPIPAGHWRITWDRVEEAFGYDVYLQRPEGVGTNSEPERQKFAAVNHTDVAVVEPDELGSDGWIKFEFVVGSGFRIAVEARVSDDTKRNNPNAVNSIRSEWISFGSHPAPTVEVTRVPGSNEDVLVSWTPTATESRGGSDVNWAVIAYVEENRLHHENGGVIADIGPEESNPGQVILSLSDTDVYPTWTVLVQATNDAGSGLPGKGIVHVENGHIELSLDSDKVWEGDDLPALTVTATVKLFSIIGDLGNATDVTLSIHVDPSSTAGEDDYTIPAGQLPITLTIPANAMHNSAASETIRGITTVDHEETSTSRKTIVFSSTLTDVRVENTTLTIYPRIRAPQDYEGEGLSATEWEIRWFDIATRHTPTLEDVSYELTLARVDGGLRMDTAITQPRTTQNSMRFRAIQRRQDNSWNGREFIHGQGFSITLQAWHSPLFAELEGIPGFDPSPSTAEVMNFGTHAAPIVTATHVPDTDADIEVEWQQTSTPGTRGVSSTAWRISAFVVGNEAATRTDLPRVADLGSMEVLGRRTITVDPSFPKWTVEVQSSNAAGLGEIGRDTVNLNEALGLDVTGDSSITEEDGQAIHWVISTPATYGSGPSPDCGNTCFPTADQTGRVAQVRRGLRSFITNTEYADLKALVDRVYEARAAGDVFDVTGDDLFTEEDGQAIHWVISTPATYGDGPSPDCGNTCFPAANQTGRVAQVRRGLRSFLTSTEYADLKALVDKVFAFATSSSQ